jgi:4-aminobutyrate aminotransferase-like enzyme
MSDHKKILELRTQYLSPSLSLSYEDPIHIVRGEGQYLYDAEGLRYLDAVNNIQHVGHCHPKVVSAAMEQNALLNTNTRYLDETIVRYAKLLTKKLPEGLDVCFFTNSGSESNDLALRIARCITGSKETIVLDGAYHGHLSSLIEISPYKHNAPGGEGPPDFVYSIPLPDSFRGIYRGDNCTADYVNEVKKVIYKINDSSKTLSAFFVEALMGCGGQIVLPEGFLKKSFELVRMSGGLCIADEVQIGFGRMGTDFWGFETCGVIPDIVTLGKSIGNGHPLSAVVTTKEIADQFNNGMEYFNSYGGNPVSCAIGEAVLNVIEDEGLQENAEIVGSYLIEELFKLQSKYTFIGQIRGQGLFIGIELISNTDTLKPNKTLAAKIVNQMKDAGILISIDGPDHNVLKIKPPMVFNLENANELVINLKTIFDKNYDS